MIFVLRCPRPVANRGLSRPRSDLPMENTDINPEADIDFSELAGSVAITFLGI